MLACKCQFPFRSFIDDHSMWDALGYWVKSRGLSCSLQVESDTNLNSTSRLRSTQCRNIKCICQIQGHAAFSKCMRLALITCYVACDVHDDRMSAALVPRVDSAFIDRHSQREDAGRVIYTRSLIHVSKSNFTGLSQ